MALSSNPPTSTADEQEQIIREHMKAGRWRAARDACKPLCKKDKSRFLPLLIEANQGLAHSMIRKSLLGEAEQVIAYLKTIATASAVQDLEETLSRAKQLQNPKESPLPAVSRTPLSSADHAVLTFACPPQTDQSPEAQDLRAVLQSLESLCRSEFDQASELLRPIARSSPFAPWRLFIKGLIAFHCYDREKAFQCFESLPTGSLPAKAAAGYLPLCKATPDTPASPLPKDTLRQVCFLAQCQPLADPLLAAEKQWKNRNHGQAYKALRAASPQFPRWDLSPTGVLSEFMFNSLFSMGDDEQDLYGRYFGTLLEKPKNSHEQALFTRVLCLTAPAELGSTLVREWKEFLRLADRLHGPSPRRKSLGLAWLGKIFAQPPPTYFNPFFSHRASRWQMRDPQAAVTNLQSAIDADPENLAAHLDLCAVFEKLKKRSERNRLLDVMVKRFPTKAPVLAMAGEECIKRKAYKKGLDYLESALQADPLNPQLPGKTLQAALDAVSVQYQKRNAVQIGRTWQRIYQLATDHPSDLQRGRWSVLVHHAFLEQAYGTEDPEPLRAQAVAACSSPALCAYHAELVALHYRSNEPASPRACPQKSVPSPEESLLLLQCLNYWSSRLAKFHQPHALKLFRLLIEQTLRLPWSASTARSFIDSSAPLTGALHFEREWVLKQGLLADPKEPVLQLQSLLLKTPPGASSRTRTKLEKILAEARRRNDTAAVDLVQPMLQQLEDAPPPFNPTAIAEQLDDLDDPNVPDGGFDGNFDAQAIRELQTLLESLPPDTGIETLAAVLGLSEKQIRQMLASNGKTANSTRKPTQQKHQFDLPL